MDIQVSSNFERLLFELLDRDAVTTASMMREFRSSGRMPVSDAKWHRARESFRGFRLDDDGTAREMRFTYESAEYLADPHTAIGLAAARALPCGHTPTVVAGTAHPAKFPDTVERATGVRPALPPRMGDLFGRDERCLQLPLDLFAVQEAIAQLANRVR